MRRRRSVVGTIDLRVDILALDIQQVLIGLTRLRSRQDLVSVHRSIASATIDHLALGCVEREHELVEATLPRSRPPRFFLTLRTLGVDTFAVVTHGL